MGCVVSRPVPYIDSGAYVSGHPAAFLAMLLRRVSATSEFSTLHPHDQENVLATIEAIQLAADKWRSRRPGHLVSANGTPGVAHPEMAYTYPPSFLAVADAPKLPGAT